MSSSEPTLLSRDIVTQLVVGSPHHPVPVTPGASSEAEQQALGVWGSSSHYSSNDEVLADEVLASDDVESADGCCRAALRPAYGIVCAILLSAVVWAVIAISL